MGPVALETERHNLRVAIFPFLLLRFVSFLLRFVRLISFFFFWFWVCFVVFETLADAIFIFAL